MKLGSTRVAALVVLAGGSLGGCPQPSVPIDPPELEYFATDGPDSEILPCVIGQSLRGQTMALDESTGRLWVLFARSESRAFNDCAMAAPGIDAISNQDLLSLSTLDDTLSVYLTWTDDAGASFARAQRLATYPDVGEGVSLVHRSVHAANGVVTAGFRPPGHAGVTLVRGGSGFEFTKLEAESFGNPPVPVVSFLLFGAAAGTNMGLEYQGSGVGPVLAEADGWEPIDDQYYAVGDAIQRGSLPPADTATMEVGSETEDSGPDLLLSTLSGSPPGRSWLQVPTAMATLDECGFGAESSDWFAVESLVARDDAYVGLLSCSSAPDRCTVISGTVASSDPPAWSSWVHSVSGLCGSFRQLHWTGAEVWQATPTGSDSLVTGLVLNGGWPVDSVDALWTRSIPFPPSWTTEHLGPLAEAALPAVLLGAGEGDLHLLGYNGGLRYLVEPGVLIRPVKKD